MIEYIIEENVPWKPGWKDACIGSTYPKENTLRAMRSALKRHVAGDSLMNSIGCEYRIVKIETKTTREIVLQLKGKTE